jgi:hypothetical protein
MYIIKRNVAEAICCLFRFKKRWLCKDVKTKWQNHSGDSNMTINQERKFLIEKVAEDFVQTILEDHPVMLYELDRELSEYITNNEQIDKKSLELREYRSSSQGYQMSARINQEIMSESEQCMKLTKKD